MNLIKAAAVRDGFKLYRDIYSDQAPLYTWLLAAAPLWDDPASLRVVALASGVIAVTGSAAIASKLGGLRTAAITALLMLSWAPVLKFFTSLVITGPAIAFCLWSLFFALPSRTGTRTSASGRAPFLAVIASGALLGLAMVTKLAFIYFVPIILCALRERWRKDAVTQRWAMVGLWFVIAALPVTLVFLTVGLPAALDSLLTPHLGAFQRHAAQAARMRRAMLLSPGMVWVYASVVLLVGLAAVVRRDRDRGLCLLVVWLLVVSGWLLSHRPLWAHHLPDLLLPLSMAIALGVTRALQAVFTPASRRVVLLVGLPALLGVFGVVLHLKSWDFWRRFYDNSSEGDLRAVAARIADASRPGDWILVDRPILAIWAGRPVPPWYSLIVQKRIDAGALADRDLARAVESYRPAVVATCTELLTGFSAFQGELRRAYEPLEEIRMFRAFVRRQNGVCRLWKRRA